MNLAGYISENLLALRNYGMDFRFSGNNGNIVGKALDTKYSSVHNKKAEASQNVAGLKM